MQFRETTHETLDAHVSFGGYPGGTSKTTVAELRTYITGKTLTEVGTYDETKATEAFAVCSYARSANVKTAENKLLDTCAEAGACPFNHHRKSNIPDGMDGLVYVLHK